MDIEVRYRASSYAQKLHRLLSVGEYDDAAWNVSIFIESFPVLRKTEKGAWIDVHGEERFVLNGPGKRYAHETIEWAVHSLRRRTLFYEANLAKRLEIANAVNNYFSDKSDEEVVKSISDKMGSMMWMDEEE